QVDAMDFRADVRGGIVYFDGLIAHVLSSLITSMLVQSSARRESGMSPSRVGLPRKHITMLSVCVGAMRSAMGAAPAGPGFPHGYVSPSPPEQKRSLQADRAFARGKPSFHPLVPNSPANPNRNLDGAPGRSFRPVQTGDPDEIDTLEPFPHGQIP